MTDSGALSTGPTRLAPGCCGLLQLCLPGFVAINTITCRSDYVSRFTTLFKSRAHAIDAMPGFLGMYVLSPDTEGEPYLVVSHWVDRASFDTWTGSKEFLDGHRRAFEDLRLAKERGEDPPMMSTFRTYSLLTT